MLWLGITSSLRDTMRSRSLNPWSSSGLRWCFTIQQKSLVKRDSDSRIFIRDIPEVNHQPTSTTSLTLGIQNQQRKPIRFESHKDENNGKILHLRALFLWHENMAAAQNARSGSSPVPTHDPDLWSRPPIQTFRKNLIQTFDPDLWKDIMHWWVDVWSSDGCMLLGFLLCSYSPCQAAKQQTVVKPSCQASKLHLS